MGWCENYVTMSHDLNTNPNLSYSWNIDIKMFVYMCFLHLAWHDLRSTPSSNPLTLNQSRKAHKKRASLGHLLIKRKNKSMNERWTSLTWLCMWSDNVGRHKVCFLTDTVRAMYVCVLVKMTMSGLQWGIEWSVKSKKEQRKTSSNDCKNAEAAYKAQTVLSRR